jgi:cytochrome c peroxidase
MTFTTRSTVAIVAAVFGLAAVAVGQTIPSFEPPPGAPPALSTIPVPEPANLYEFVADKQAAIQLGKALYWDMQIGSDGVTACATCHFQAGADSRTINQVNPGGDRRWYVGPNLHLRREYFPLRRLSDPTDRSSPPILDVNDVVSSQGVFKNEFKSIDPGSPNDDVKRRFDPVFSVSGLNVRRVEPRNTPTVINAVFNHRNFWDGRAQNDFNGINNWGDRDPDAHVYRALTPTGPLEAIRLADRADLRLTNASLASQAVAPILSQDEMSAADRNAVDIGNKLLNQRGKNLVVVRPLAFQVVHPDDSVLGPLSRSPQPGLNVASYADLIRQAFRSEWWDSPHALRVSDKGKVNVLLNKKGATENDLSLMEYNFTLFFGLALQLYQATLVSDDTPYDRWVRGDPGATISQDAFDGLKVFIGQDKTLPTLPKPTVLGKQGARCINCHQGAELTDASVNNVKLTGATRNREEQDIDRGYSNIGVRPTLEDIGVGGMDPFGKPLSLTRLNPVKSGRFIAVDGAFKTPGLRNVELTAPYFHNGGYLTLESVMEFYSRGGDMAPLLAADQTTALRPLGIPAESAPTHGFPRGLTADERRQLVAFMKSLTDDRVKYRKAPFDHPQLYIPNGQFNDHVSADEDPNKPGQARDRVLMIEAVGRQGGRSLPLFLQP